MAAPRLEVARETLEALCRRWKVRQLSLFGSVLRDDFGPDSDVDVLVEFLPDGVPSLFTIQDLEQELSAVFGGRAVDLVTPGALHPLLRERILADAQVQFAA